MRLKVTKIWEGEAETAPFVAEELKFPKSEYVMYPHDCGPRPPCGPSAASENVRPQESA
jgi:hypothetical protein